MQQGTHKTPRAVEAKAWGSKERKHDAQLRRRQIDRATVREALAQYVGVGDPDHLCDESCGAL